MSTSNIVPMGEIVSYIRGITFKPQDKVQPHSIGSAVCMTTKNIQGTLDESIVIAVPYKFVKREEQYLREGDLLVSSANSWNLVGKTCYVPSLVYKATAGGFISIVRPKMEKVEPRYLYHWLSSKRTQHYTRLCARQTTNIANLSREQFLNLRIPLLPLKEQKRITAILDKADAVRRKRQESIRLTEKFLKSVFLDMFGDPVTNPKGWPIVKMSDVVSDTQYGTSDKANTENEGLPVLRMNNITYNGEIDVSNLKWCPIAKKDEEKYTVRRGDLLFNRTNSPELVGKTAVWRSEEKYAFAGYLVRIRFDIQEALSEYVSAYLNSCYGKKFLFVKARPSNNMSNFSASEFIKIPLPLPPIDIQFKFVKISETARCSVKQHEKLAKNSDDLFNSLAQRAFRGAL